MPIVYRIIPLQTGLLLEATLKDAAGNPLANKTINFYVSTDGTNYSQIGSGTTDTSGVATATYTPSGTGTYYFKAEFPGDAQYEGSVATAQYTVGAVSTTLTLSTAVSNKTVTLTAVLKDVNGNPLAGKTIYFYVSTDGTNYTQFSSATTDSSGVATATYQAPSAGTYYFKAEFKGDATYSSAVAYATVEVTEATAGAGCEPIFRTGISQLDTVLFCIGNYGITVAVVAVAFVLLLLLLRR